MALNGLLGTGVVVTFSAGCWQLYRLRWKESLVAERKDSLLGRPVTNKQFSPDTPLHTLVALKGQYVATGMWFVGPRPAPKSADPLPRQNPPGYEVGVLVVAPFLVADTHVEQKRQGGWWTHLWGTRAEQPSPRHQVLVNRGWIPWLHYEQWKQSGRPPEYLSTEGTIQLHAVTQPDEEEKAETMFPLPGVHGRVRAAILGAIASEPKPPTQQIDQFHLEAVDINSFEHGTDPTLPLFKREMPITRYSREFMHGYVSPEKHQEYALFWMGSCAAICALSYAARRPSASASVKRRPRLK